MRLLHATLETHQDRDHILGHVLAEHLSEKLRGLGAVDSNPFLLRAFINEFEITVFADGRAIIKGTEDEVVARNVYAKYIGN